jgi:hypothetical protein
MLMRNMVILLNNKHYDSVPAADLIKRLEAMLFGKAWVPMRDIIEIVSHEEWVKRRKSSKHSRARI